MADYTVPVRAEAFIFYCSLVSQADTKTYQSNPTLASGDVQVSKDGGTLTNLATLPTVTPASGKLVKVSLSADEMTADNVAVVFSDAAGAQWCDFTVNIQTAARGVDDLAFPTTTGRSIDVSTAGEVGLDWANIGSPTTTVGLSGTTVKTATDVETDTADIQGRLPSALVSGRIDASVGAMAAGVVTAASVATAALTAAKFAAGAIDAAAVAADAANEIADALLDRASAVDSYTVRQILRGMAAVLMGKVTGAQGAEVFRSADDSANRVTATSSNGNRSAVTLNLGS